MSTVDTSQDYGGAVLDESKSVTYPKIYKEILFDDEDRVNIDELLRIIASKRVLTITWNALTLPALGRKIHPKVHPLKFLAYITSTEEKRAQFRTILKYDSLILTTVKTQLVAGMLAGIKQVDAQGGLTEDVLNGFALENPTCSVIKPFIEERNYEGIEKMLHTI